MATHRLCSIPDCSKPAHALGFCSKHYTRLRRHGDPLADIKEYGHAQRHLAEVVRPYEGDECLLWPFNKTNSGYGMVYQGKKSSVLVHRLLCQEVNGPPPTPKHEAAHTCGNGKLGCVTKRHVVWKTHAENMADTFAHGTHNRGERCGTSKLTESDVLAIRAEGTTRSCAAVAAQYGVTRSLIGSIRRRERWAWL